MDADLLRVRGIADYQFGPNCGLSLFPDNVSIEYSKNTGKIRLLFIDDVLLASLRPTDGMFTLTIAGAERIISKMENFAYAVTVMDEVSKFISQGKNVFSKHVTSAGPMIRPGDEVIVVDSNNQVLAVGKALLNGIEMLSFKTGVAVKTRRGKDRNR